MILEEIKLEHIENIRAWRNSQLDVLRQSKRITKKEQLEYFNTQVWNSKNKQSLDKDLYMIRVKDDYIGYGGITNLTKAHFRGEISFLLNPILNENQSKYCDLFSTFLDLISNIAIRKHKLHKLYTETYHFRTRHIQVLENSGFIKEGVLKDHIYINGSFMDSYLHGKILKKK